MNNTIISVLIFWGIWVILPVMIDGVLLCIYSATIFYAKIREKIRPKPKPSSDLPLVSVIIPTYNEEQNISICLNFLKIQTYPHDKIEIIVVDNGSVDNTGEIVMAHKGEGDLDVTEKNRLARGTKINGKIMFGGKTYDTQEYKGTIHLITQYTRGKSQALNAGIRAAKGEIIINIDSRAFLDPNAISAMVKAFQERKDMGAATGNIEINWNLIYDFDPKKGFALDREGYLVNQKLPFKKSFLAKSQFLEYLSSFHIGRYFRDITDSMFTMSGAFSAIRRDVLLKTDLYKDKTVVEDTHLTLDLGSIKTHIGYVVDAKAYLKPVTSWERLYAQRIRWRRGQVEVMGLYYSRLGKPLYGLGRMIFLPADLVIDHTFAFPRLLWFFILPSLIFFGYQPVVVLIASLLMYGFYILLDLVITGLCYLLSDQTTRAQIRDAFHWIPLLPIYRLILFFIRMSAYLVVLRDEPEWTVHNNLIGDAKRIQSNVQRQIMINPIKRMNDTWLSAKKNFRFQAKSSEGEES